MEMTPEEREEHETIEAIHRNLEDVRAGRVRTLEEVDAEIRAEFGFRPMELSPPPPDRIARP